jgi:hypothetical protein
VERATWTPSHLRGPSGERFAAGLTGSLQRHVEGWDLELAKEIWSAAAKRASSFSPKELQTRLRADRIIGLD